VQDLGQASELESEALAIEKGDAPPQTHSIVSRPIPRRAALKVLAAGVAGAAAVTSHPTIVAAGAQLPVHNLGITLPGALGNGAQDYIDELDAFKNSLAAALNIADPASQRAMKLFPAWYNRLQNMGHHRAVGDTKTTGNRFVNPNLLHDLRDRGVVPMISWGTTGRLDDENFFQHENGLVGAPNYHIAMGGLDSVINKFADEYIAWQASIPAHDGLNTTTLKGTPKQQAILIRPFWEVNNPGYPFYDGRFLNYPFEANTAQNFRRAWRKLHNRIQNRIDAYNATHSVPVTNHLKWVYCALGPGESHIPYVASHYPGDAYVDYFGIDVYNWLENGHGRAAEPSSAACSGGTGGYCSGQRALEGHGTHGNHEMTDGFWTDVPGGSQNSLARRTRVFYENMVQAVGTAKPYIVCEFGVRNMMDNCAAHPQVACDGHPGFPAHRKLWLAGAKGVPEVFDNAWDPNGRIQSMGYYNVDHRTGDVTQHVNWQFGPSDMLRGWAELADNPLYQDPFDFL
jgi:hypothetical protein